MPKANIRLNLLFIDDETGFIDFAKRDLGDRWKVMGCSSFAEVRSVLDRGIKFDAAIIDLHVPQGIGESISQTELVSRLLSAKSKIGFISARANENDIGYARSLGIKIFDKMRIVDFKDVIALMYSETSSMNPERQLR